jgi:hypothetical protein
MASLLTRIGFAISDPDKECFRFLSRIVGSRIERRRRPTPPSASLRPLHCRTFYRPQRHCRIAVVSRPTAANTTSTTARPRSGGSAFRTRASSGGSTTTSIDRRWRWRRPFGPVLLAVPPSAVQATPRASGLRTAAESSARCSGMSTCGCGGGRAAARGRRRE